MLVCVRASWSACLQCHGVVSEGKFECVKLHFLPQNCKGERCCDGVAHTCSVVRLLVFKVSLLVQKAKILVFNNMEINCK